MSRNAVVTYDQMEKFLVSFHKDPQGLRLGQAFINKFLPGVTDPALFYEENQTKAINYIYTHYVGKNK